MDSYSFRETRKDLFILLFIWSSCFLLDFFWIDKHLLPPAWDQGSHLSTAFDVNYHFNSLDFFNIEWWNQLWSKFPGYRGPFTYIVSIPFFRIFGVTFQSAVLSNQFFNALIILSTYFLGRIIHTREAGLWASFFCSISPAFVIQRTDYLIDLSLTSVVTTTWLFLSIWQLRIKSNQLLFLILSGISLGILFITKPTGIIFLWLPFTIIFIHIISELFRKRIAIFVQSSFMILIVYLIAWPWFSINWLTILLNINKARQWGVNYQEGLESNSLEGWLYYPSTIPYLFGKLLLGLLISAILINIIQAFINNNNIYIFNYKYKNLIWWISFPLGALFICILMTTKDIRFLLPLVPQFFILSGIIVSSIQTKWSLIWKYSLITVGSFSVVWSQFAWGINITGFEPSPPIDSEKWPLEQIIGTIKNKSPFQLSTLAVLTDSRKLNAFNLDAEGKRQNNLVAARQTYYQSDNLIEELHNFDWFLIKTGNKGVMSGEKELMISKLVRNSNSFKEESTWNLPDGSKAYLYRRDPLSVHIENVSCPIKIPSFDIQNITNGLELISVGNLSQINKSKLLIDINDGLKSYRADQSIALGMARLNGFDSDSCFKVVQRVSSQIPFNEDSKLQYVANLIFQDGRNEITTISQNKLDLNQFGKYQDSIAVNRIDAIYEMAKQLRIGNLEELFTKVGKINQGDPEQIYLKDSELIVRTRLQNNPKNLDDLYALALSQTLQRKANEASDTFKQICNLDTNNKYAYLAKAFIEIYRFKPNLAKMSLTRAERLNTDPDLYESLKVLKIAVNIIGFNFINVVNIINS